MEIKTKKGESILIDDDAPAEIFSFYWGLSNRGYARRKIKGKYIFLHRVVVNAKPGEIVDHINRIKTDNRISNLRIVTSLESSINRSGRKGSKSGLKGVSSGPKGKNWQVYCKEKYIGFFKTLRDAAQAYNKAAIETFGNLAVINTEEDIEKAIAKATGEQP